MSVVMNAVTQSTSPVKKRNWKMTKAECLIVGGVFLVVLGTVVSVGGDREGARYLEGFEEGREVGQMEAELRYLSGAKADE